MLTEFNLKLTLKQQFQLRLIKNNLVTANLERLKESALKTTHPMMLQENVIWSLSKGTIEAPKVGKGLTGIAVRAINIPPILELHYFMLKGFR